ncbi:MAG: universal stress protein [Hyphomicrobiales bacterium]|nr:universal stress protein [Hyphomicrobiales bacterium]
MPLKDILVHADNSKNAEIRLEYASQLAKTHKAHLTGLYVKGPNKSGAPSRGKPNYVVPDLGGRSLKEFEEKSSEVEKLYSEHAQLANAAAKQRFEGLVDEHGVKHGWISTEGPMMDALTYEARFCDVAVVGQPGPDSARQFGETVTDHLILSVGHPVLVVPTLKEDFTVGKRVLIAWDRSPLATRAVHNSRPFMRHADSVHILGINLEPESHGGVPGSGITEHLARHDIEATPIHVTGATDAPADVILSQAKKLDIDLIIMGAYGHSRLRERILGGNTYQLLNHSPVAMLMSH